ncbi:hypothetical protein MYCO108962_01915 [Mycobacterium colombiense]
MRECTGKAMPGVRFAINKKKLWAAAAKPAPTPTEIPHVSETAGKQTDARSVAHAIDGPLRRGSLGIYRKERATQHFSTRHGKRR